MGLIDLLVTPFYFFILFLIAYLYKSRNRKDYLIYRYFLKAYVLRIFGGIAFGCVYYFYYGGGDTFNFHSDSVIVSSALRDEPRIGLQLLFGQINLKNWETYSYVSQLIFKNDVASQSIIKISAVLNLITFDSFLSTTILFSLIGFWGSWRLFLTLCKMFPSIHKELAIGCLYLPSILFWSSGIMKDTICTTALCFLFSAIVEVFVYEKYSAKNFFAICFTLYILFVVKIYILLCFIPTVSIYIFSLLNSRIKSRAIKIGLKPILLVGGIFLSYYVIDGITKENEKYNLENIENTAQITASYIEKVSVKTGGSFYNLGALDFSVGNLPLLALKAINVTLYRPYIWELNSPLMIFSVSEGIYFSYLTYLLIRHVSTKRRGKNFLTPFTSFCFLFTIIFAFVVGVTSNNFGTLARYKSLMLPFFVCGVYVTVKSKND